MTGGVGLVRPDVSTADAARIALDCYGITASAQELGSNQDRNFLLTAEDGAKSVLRIDNAVFGDAARDALDDHLQHVRARLAELQALESDLLALRNRCDGSDAHCHIIEALHARADAQLPDTVAGTGPRKRHV